MTGLTENPYLGTLCVTLPFGGGSGLLLCGDQQFDWQGKKVNFFGVSLSSVTRDVMSLVGKHLRISGPLVPPKGGYDDSWPVIEATNCEVVPCTGHYEEHIETDSLTLSVIISPPEFSWEKLSSQPSIQATLTNTGTTQREFRFQNSGQLWVKVTEIVSTPVFGLKETWAFPEATNDVLGSARLDPNQSLTLETDLPRSGAPDPATYILSVQLCGHTEFSTQTQFLVRP